jgi:NADPH2:quinone reductase
VQPGPLGDRRQPPFVPGLEVAGTVRELGPGVTGFAVGEWGHQLGSNRLWYGGLTVTGFNAGAYIPTHPREVRPAAEAALEAVAAGLAETEIEMLPFDEAVTAH